LKNNLGVLDVDRSWKKWSSRMRGEREREREREMSIKDNVKTSAS
jgi:hypothetical protein